MTGIIPSISTMKGDYPTQRLLFTDNFFAAALEWYFYKNKQDDGITPISWGQVKAFRGYLGASLVIKRKSWVNFPVANTTYERIKRDPRFKHHVPQGAVALTPSEDLKLAEVGCGEAIRDSLKFKAAVAYNICRTVGWTGARGSTPQKLNNEDLSVENERKVFGVHRPRNSYNKTTDKTHKSVVKVRRSEAGTLMRATECGCPEGSAHSEEYGVTCDWNMISAMMAEKEKEWVKFMSNFDGPKADAVKA